MSRISRTWASSTVAQGTWSTLVARVTIRPIRDRVSDAVKYERTRARRLREVPM